MNDDHEEDFASVSVMAHGTTHRRQATFLDGTDPSSYMLGLPRSHPNFGKWFVFAILTGTALALLLFVIETLIF
jgi:hypothetical protein